MNDDLVVHFTAFGRMTQVELFGLCNSAVQLREQFADTRPAVAQFWHEVASAVMFEIRERGLVHDPGARLN